jgi:hypothetical protein
MPAMISSLNVTMDKTFRRLLFSTEKLLEEKSIEDWKLDQVKENIEIQISSFFQFSLLAH